MNVLRVHQRCSEINAMACQQLRDLKSVFKGQYMSVCVCLCGSGKPYYVGTK